MRRIFRFLVRIGSGAAASVVASSASAGLLRLISSMTLTRLLDSSAYGIVGILLSISSVLNMVSDIGLNQFILRHQRGDERDFLDELWTLRLLRALFLTGAALLLAKPLAWLLDKPELTPVLLIWGFSFLVDGLASLASATAIREGQLWRLSLLDFCANLAQFLVSVVFAILFRSYWALVAGMLCGTAIRSVASYLLFPVSRRRLRLSRERGRELWAFSRNIALSSVMTLVIMQSDRIILARLMPLATFGLYSIAVTLTLSAGYLASSYAARVLAGNYARVARTEPHRLKAIFYRSRRRLPLMQMGAIGLMIGGAPLMIAILYDDRFRGVVPYFQWLAIGAALRVPTSAAQYALVALGVTRPNVTANAARMLWLAAGAGVGLAGGNVMAMVALVGTIEVPALLCNWNALARHRLLDLREECLGLAILAVGALVGYLISMVGLALFPGL